MDTKMKTMKTASKLISFIWLIMITLSGCQYGENVICNQAPLYNKGFDMSNLITILNPKDTFDLGDTLWMRIEIPTSFYGNKKSCTFDVVSKKIDVNINTYYLNRQYESFFGFYTIVPKVGTYTGAYNFSKINDSYLAVFGAVLNDTALTDIGADTSSPYGIRLHSYDDIGCTYDDDDCAIGKKRHPYQNGFNINTSFQGGIKRWKINMRK